MCIVLFTILPEPASGHPDTVFGYLHSVFGHVKKGTDATVCGFYIM